MDQLGPGKEASLPNSAEMLENVGNSTETHALNVYVPFGDVW